MEDQADSDAPTASQAVPADLEAKAWEVANKVVHIKRLRRRRVWLVLAFVAWLGAISAVLAWPDLDPGPRFVQSIAYGLLAGWIGYLIGHITAELSELGAVPPTRQHSDRFKNAEAFLKQYSTLINIAVAVVIGVLAVVLPLVLD